MADNKFLSVILIPFLLISCSTFIEFKYLSEEEAQEIITRKAPPYPSARFSVIADPHLYNPSLGTSGEEFQKYVETHMRLIHYSEDILKAVFEIILNTDCDFIIICGDLTKDGEFESHLLLTKYLTRLEESGKQVFVVPGNHDIMNFNAARFTEQGKERVASITPEQFSTLYADFGYKEAIYRDENSLSYIVEPVEGLWLFALDSCRYRENSEKNPSTTGGKFNKQTLFWLEDMLIKANKNGKAIIGMMHHGMIEHFNTQKKYLSDYVVADYDQISGMCATYNMKLVFTGHFHAQDITLKSLENGKFLYDVETSSLISYPCAIRFVEITSEQQAFINSQKIETISSYPGNFSRYIFDFQYRLAIAFISRKLKEYNFSDKDIELLMPQLITPLIAHYRGDEVPPEKILDVEFLQSRLYRFIIKMHADLVRGVWHDLPTSDNNISIDLNTGNWTQLSQ